MMSRAAIDTEQEYRRHDVHDAISEYPPSTKPLHGGRAAVSRILERKTPSSPSSINFFFFCSRNNKNNKKKIKKELFFFFFLKKWLLFIIYILKYYNINFV